MHRSVAAVHCQKHVFSRVRITAPFLRRFSVSVHRKNAAVIRNSLISQWCGIGLFFSVIDKNKMKRGITDERKNRIFDLREMLDWTMSIRFFQYEHAKLDLGAVSRILQAAPGADRTLRGIYHATSIVCEIPSGAAADLWGRKRCMILSNLCIAVSCVIMLFSKSFRCGLR